MSTYKDFEKDLKDTLHILTNYKDPMYKYCIWDETIPFLEKLIELNEYRILTISSQPNKVITYHRSGIIEIQRSFLWFYVENNEIGLLLIDKLKNNKNIYIQCHGEKDITFSNFPFYKCTKRVYLNDSEYENEEMIGYPHMIHLEPATYKIIHERIIMDTDWYKEGIIDTNIDDVYLGHVSYEPAKADYLNCFYIRVTTVNTINECGLSAIEEVLNAMNELKQQ